MKALRLIMLMQSLLTLSVASSALCAVRGTAPATLKYRDGRPAASLRMDARDHGIVLRYGDGPSQCDILGARDVWVFEECGTFYMHYDAAGPKGWLSSLAVSKDLLTWEKKGPILDFGKPGEDDSAGACYGVTYKQGDQWHMFYLGTPNASAPPALVPSFPYLTMKAKASDPAGPWIKQKDVVPFRTKPNTYYSLTASPGHVIKNGDEYLQFFSSTTRKPGNPCVQRTLGIARTKDLDGPWTVDPHPMVPIEEQIENSTLYYEESNKTWFLFTNHIGIDKGEYTDAIWVYWSKDLNRWDPKDKAIVLDGQNCTWSTKCIGLPSVVQVGDRLALLYDAPGGDSTSHMKRSVGLAWLDLPLSVPKTDMSIKVTHLRCEYLENPLGIDQTKPRLSWKLQSSRRGQKQTAYRVLVASSRETLAKNVGDLWDSGKVTEEQSLNIRYGGKRPETLQQCFWKVMVWDKTGQPSPWSKRHSWTMGMLAASGWKADWIGATANSAMEGMGRGFRSKPEESADAVKWVQVDLGKEEAIDRILLYTVKFFHDSVPYYTPDHGFPLRFFVEVADNPEMQNARRVLDHTEKDYYPPGWPHCRVPIKLDEGISGRYLRITATKLRREKDNEHWFGLAEIQVFSPRGRNLADGAPVDTSDSLETGEWSATNLTQYFKTEESSAVLLRKELVLEEKPVRAIACMSGLGMSELYLNGKKVDDHKLDPADTDYRKRVMYVTHDVTDGFEKGKNALGVILGNGWYDINFRDIWDFEGSTWAASKRLLFQIELEFADGSSQTIVSNPDWKWSTGEIVYNSLRGGETIDANRKQTGWELPGFDDSSWKPVVTLDAPEGRLESQQHVPNRQTREVRPVKILEPSPGIYVYDLGQNFSGWVKFRASGQKGGKVQLNFAEQLNDQGMIDQDHWSSSYIYGRYQTGELILSGNEKDLFEPRFTYFGFQYVQVEGLPAKPSLDDMVGVMVHVDPKEKGGFACSNERFNRLHSVITHSLLNYTHHRPRDPAREKLGWTQDVWQLAGPSLYNYDLGSVYRLWFRDMKAGQEASGHVPPVNPSPVWGNWGQPGSNLSCPWWGGAMHYGPWQLYHFTGDMDLLRELYPGMKASLDFIHGTSKELTIDWGLGDWGEVGTTGPPVNTPRNFTNTCAFYYLATISAQIAEILGETEDALKYSQLANDICDAFNQKFLDFTTGSYGENSQTKYALPLLLGMVPNEIEDMAKQHLIEEVKRSDGHLSTGFVGSMALMKVLSDLDPELAYAIANQEDEPSWWGMIKDGRTTIPEFWNGEGVQNIVSLGGPLENWFYYGLAGIRPDPASPGFKHCIIKPAFIKELDWLKAHHNSPYGRICVDWARKEDQIQFRLTIPVGSTATLHIPGQSITEGGSPTAEAEGVSALHCENGISVFKIESGIYDFSINI